jgi:hypothetical protein
MMPQQSRGLCFHHDFDGPAPGVVATDGQSGSGISPPTVSCPFAPANMIGNCCSTRSSAFDAPKTLVAIVAANRDHESTRIDGFIVASIRHPTPSAE